jgi:ppGpp synthetase/RelA/SpoT-type nucleotidyltranferase
MEKNNVQTSLISDKDIQELNGIRMALEQTLTSKLSNAGIYFHNSSRVKSQDSLNRKLATGKYGADRNDKKIQDIIGIRINLFYSEDIKICEYILEDTFMVDNWSKSEWEENRFEAQKCNGVFHIPSKYLKNISDKMWEQPFDKTFEVQLRTVLFEGWHEIEHEMRYKYKVDEEYEVNSLWSGQEKNARVMNSIIANLELCDWSIVQIFDNIARAQFKSKHWENAIRSHYRLRITQDSLKPEIVEYLNNNPEVADRLLSVTKQQLVNILLNKKYQKVLSPNRVVYLINKEIVHDEYISSQLDREQFGRVINNEIKEEMKPMVSNLVFGQSICIPEESYMKACNIIYDWAYDHISLIFGQMPKDMENVAYETMGYKLTVDVNEAEFHMDMQHISNEEAGVIWHVTADITQTEQGRLLAARNICENIYSRERRYSRPRFMRDIYNQIGYIDADILLNENVMPQEISNDDLGVLLSNENRTLPILLVLKPSAIPEWAQDFDGYVINTNVLSKTLGGISHVVLGDETCKAALTGIYGAEVVDGAVVYWNKNSGKRPILFSMEAIKTSCFEEVNHSVEEDKEYDKAFRYRLRELVSQEFCKE